MKGSVSKEIVAPRGEEAKKENWYQTTGTDVYMILYLSANNL